MNKNTVPNILAIVGALIGYGIGRVSHAGSVQLIVEMTSGMFLLFQISRLYFMGYYSILIGAFIGLLISIGSDVLAGSDVVLTNKLAYMSFGLIAAWPLGKYLKLALIIGGIGGSIGFVLGLTNKHLFGKGLWCINREVGTIRPSGSSS